MTNNGDLMDKIVSLSKRRGFIFPGSEIYGGLANAWDYGPLGVELKNNIRDLWWKRFVTSRDDMVGLDAAIIMNPKVWEASGHVKNFSDLLSECRKCHNRIRVDHYLSMADIERFSVQMKDLIRERGEKDPLEAESKLKTVYKEMGEVLNVKTPCPVCGAKEWTDARPFNTMMVTYFGISQDSANLTYLRPETAQAMFVDFKNVLDTSRKQIPFGIAQIGKAFRNEITPGNFIFRTREFEQMEIEYFIRPEEWEKWFEYWRVEMRNWIEEIGGDMSKVHEVEISESERAHYSKRTMDFEFEYPFGQKELYGLAYRTDFDLRNHETASGLNLKYRDPQTNEELLPHVIEPTWGLNRSMLMVLLSAYREEEKRAYLKLKPALAPYKAAVFPLLANKPQLVEKAREIYDSLRRNHSIAWDDRGNIGKRYYSQDEIGTPYCITVDFDTLDSGTVTVRDRDTATQERIAVDDLKGFIADKLAR
ncbi:MAG: glycine--tRNA ligase [Candidatus Liptonbacteria bacterium]